jgi:hypothetical protein
MRAKKIKKLPFFSSTFASGKRLPYESAMCAPITRQRCGYDYLPIAGAEGSGGARKGTFCAFGSPLQGQFLCTVNTTFLFRELTRGEDSN